MVSEEITPKERVYRTLEHEETDIVPYNIPIHPLAHEKLVKIYGEGYSKCVINHFANLSFTFEAAIPAELEDKIWVDEFGCTWRQGSIFSLVKPALTEPSLEGYKFPDFSNPERYKRIPEEIERHKDKFFAAGAGLLFFERAWAMRRLEQILIDFYRYPDFVKELLDNLMELNLQMVEGVVQYDVDAVRFGDDYGTQKGLIMKPETWRKFLKPRLKQIYGRAERAGKFVMIHSCGDNSSIMGDLIEIGVDIFHPIQPEAMNIYELKEKYGSQITFNGGITTQRLPFMTPKDIREEVKRVRASMSKGGGFVLEPSKPIRWDVLPETAMALIDEITNPSN